MPSGVRAKAAHQYLVLKQQFEFLEGALTRASEEHGAVADAVRADELSAQRRKLLPMKGGSREARCAQSARRGNVGEEGPGRASVGASWYVDLIAPGQRVGA